MSTAEIRYSLILDLLQHRPESHMILADMLDEENEPELASWSRKVGKWQRLELSLSVLPPRVALGLACDFLAHAVNVHEEWAFLKNPLHRIGQWANGEVEDSDLVESIEVFKRLVNWEYRLRNLNWAANALLTAVKSTQILASPESLEPSPVDRHADRVDWAVRKVAGESRAIHSSKREYEWQFNRTRQVVAGLIEQSRG